MKFWLDKLVDIDIDYNRSINDNAGTLNVIVL